MKSPLLKFARRQEVTEPKLIHERATRALWLQPTVLDSRIAWLRATTSEEIVQHQVCGKCD